MRKAQVSSSPEFLQILRVVSGLRPGDLKLADALLAAGGSEHRAASLLGTRSDTLRQRVSRLAGRLEQLVPGLKLRRGRQSVRLEFRGVGGRQRDSGDPGDRAFDAPAEEE